MSILDNEYKIALDYLINKGVTAYELNKFSGKSEAGLRKILKGDIDNPQRKTKDIVIKYYNLIKEKSDFIKSKNHEYTKGIEKFTPKQIATYISENIELFNIEELMQILFEKSVLKEANNLVETKLNELKIN